MIKIENYTDGLIEREGIYISQKAGNISYPYNGNDVCFQLEDSSFWFRHRNQCIIEAVKEYCPSAHFFDVGGGNGFVSKELEANGIETVLVEPGMQGCLHAKQRNITTIICATMEEAHLKANSIPAIGLFDVVEHIENDLLFLSQVYDYLQPGGHVFITVPAFRFLWSYEDDYAGHFRRYTIRQLADKLKKVGFSIEYSTYLFSILPIPVFLMRTIGGLFRYGKKPDNISKHKNEHKNRTGWTAKVLDKVWKYELNKIKQGKKIPIGGSCIVVAKKVC